MAIAGGAPVSTINMLYQVAGSLYFNGAAVGGSGGGAMGRTHVRGTTSALGFYENANLNLEFAESADLVAVTAAHDCWIRVYNTAAARTADANRAMTTPPTPGTGIVGDIYPYGPDNLYTNVFFSSDKTLPNVENYLGQLTTIASRA